MSGSQKPNSTPIVMDARKFVRQINNGASAKLNFFAEAITRMGAAIGKKLRLASLDADSLIYEDVEKSKYFLADIKKANHGKVHIANVRPIHIVEEEKGTQFSKNVRDLVENICSDNFNEANKLFERVEGQRFRSRVIPESGWITLKDGVSRKVNVSNRIVKEDHAKNIIRLFSEAVRDKVELDSNGRVIHGTLSDGSEKFTIPINEYTRRRLVAHKMRTVAESAYNSPSFQDLVVETASLVCENKIADAVKLASKFLKEEQEFTLLDKKGLNTLVEDALATRCEFNSMLASDVATLMYKTNLKINHSTILEAWTKMAQKAEHPGLLTNVNVLAESENFEEDYNKFLGAVFNEEMDVQQARAKAYKTVLRVIASILPGLEDEEGEEISTSVDELNELIERLSTDQPDTKVVLQAEELLAGISDSLVDSIKDLQGFDQMPGEESGEGEEEEGGELVPLPEVGGEEDEEDVEEPPMGEEVPAEEEPEAEEGAPPLPPPMESKNHPKLVEVEKMDLNTLNEQFEAYHLHGETYLMEDGGDSCLNDMDRYIKRCIELGPSAGALRAKFEGMRGRILDSAGNQILESLDDDRYGSSVLSAISGSDKPKSAKDPENDPAFWGPKKVAVESRINKNYRTLSEDQPYGSALVSKGVAPAADPLSMDELQGKGGVADKNPSKSDGRSVGGSTAGYHAKQSGKGVVGKGTKQVDGRKGLNSTSGSAGGSTRMDDAQGSGGVQAKNLNSSDGRKGFAKSSQASESSEPGMVKGGKSVGLGMSELQGKDTVQSKSVQKTDGRAGDGATAAKKYTTSGGLKDAGTRMDDLRGKGGVCKLHPEENCHCDPFGNVDNEGDLEPASKGDASEMGKNQGKGGVAESITPERIAAMISEMDNIVEDKGCPCCDGGKCECKPGCAGCECKAAMSEGEIPAALQAHQFGSKDKGKGCPCCDGGKCECKPGCAGCKCKAPGGEEDKPEISEAQRHPPTKRRKGGMTKASMADKNKKTVNEATAVVVTDKGGHSLGDAVSQILSGMGDDVDDVDNVTDTFEEPVEPAPMPEVAPEDGGLEDALDSALGPDELMAPEMPEAPDGEVEAEGMNSVVAKDLDEGEPEEPTPPKAPKKSKDDKDKDKKPKKDSSKDSK